MRHRLNFLIIPIIFLLTACGGDAPDSKPVKKIKKVKNEKVAKASGLNGKKLYITHCSVCHMPNGLGVKGSFPPLADTKWVNGPAEVMIDIVLNGFSEEIEVNGDKYVTPMAALPHIKDDELAAILTYVRSSFGNDASEVTQEEVAAVRAKG